VVKFLHTQNPCNIQHIDQPTEQLVKITPGCLGSVFVNHREDIRVKLAVKRVLNRGKIWRCTRFRTEAGQQRAIRGFLHRLEKFVKIIGLSNLLHIKPQMRSKKDGQRQQIFPVALCAEQPQTVKNLFDFSFSYNIGGKLFADGELIPAQCSVIIKHPAVQQRFEISAVNRKLIHGSQFRSIARVLFQISRDFADAAAFQQRFIIGGTQAPAVHGARFSKNHVGRHGGHHCGIHPFRTGKVFQPIVRSKSSLTHFSRFAAIFSSNCCARRLYFC